MRSALKTGAALGAFTLATAALAILPGRVALGRDQAKLGRSAAELIIAGTLRDLSDVALPLGGIVGVALATVLVLRPDRAIRVLTGLLAVAAVVIWFVSAGAAEFKLQRGVDATWFDFQLGAKSSSVLWESLGFLTFHRHSIPAALALALALVLRHGLCSHPWVLEKRVLVVAGYALATILGFAMALVPLDPHVRLFRTITDRKVVGEPFVSLFSNLGRSRANVRLGMRGLIERARFPADAAKGEALLGLPARAATDCATHPMARALPVDGVETPVSPARPLAPRVRETLVLLDRLSAELYADRTTPIDVWQVMMESFRGDDVHAIMPAAPRDLAPFIGSLYENHDNAISVGHMWQAGSRTSQGFSSYMCGLGMLPYGLSITRDFGPLPLRCLPDVLTDAGFEGAFFFGGSPSFDEMEPFFLHHGVRTIVGRQQLPLDAPTGEVGVSDRALVAAAVDRSRPRPDRGRYTLVMTGSNHIPYSRPEDVPAEVDARVRAITSAPDFAGNADDAKRLLTFAYADHAVRELHDRLPRERSILVLGADHATADPFVWPRSPEWTLHAAHGLIPFAIVIPEALIAMTRRPEAVHALVREINAVMSAEAWSQNDVPTLLLALLSHAPGLMALAAEWRWHTIGGERTSPYFEPPKPEVDVIGINSVAELFGTDAHDQQLLSFEQAAFVQDEKEIYSASPSLLPVAATLSRFLNGYATVCRAQPNNALITPRGR